ncbi:hypothetical protein Cst_c19590 [Thermoclostridium stercorarium subsp. stercorarium DSM 8532]|uniref:Uncharacterized protein n=1 Tax=Thermoclostridium stercorarium (strain ATCC 35414 / DSM 8532 / NCIMB 11754) TaxID=1121335 RepID=L7VQG2_THES1|nr:hypothetical protein Cst_c19590 [Thermoclostridium stercorarium subsp. stercorarium DSM 8532]
MEQCRADLIRLGKLNKKPEKRKVNTVLKETALFSLYASDGSGISRSF